MIIYNNNKPYTYLIGWSKTNMFYYGVRYSKTCRPDDLWVTYFTSSKHVKHYRNKHGDPDIIEVRKIFSSRSEAIDWEHKVLRRMDVAKDKRFLNHTINACIKPEQLNKNPVRNLKNIGFSNWSKESQDSARKKMSENAKRMHQEGRFNYNKPEDTTNYIKSAYKRWSDGEYRSKMKSKRWMCHPEHKSRMVSPELWESFLLDGYVFGRTFRPLLV